MNFIMNMFRGIMIGIANVIPGVSGGTMAVSFGIYDKLISSITGFFKDWKKSVRFLLPIGLGMGIGLVAFSYAIEFLFTNYPFPTSLTFIGLILGGVPMIYKAMKKDLNEKHKGFSILHGILFVLFFALVAGLPLMRGEGAAVDLSVIGAGKMLALFLVGVIASATMIIPGVSGSMVMLILGYYTSIINAITDFLNSLVGMDMDGLVHGFLILVPLGIGIIVGVVGIAKLIEFLFAKYCSLTYSAILGLICASPIAMFINMKHEGSLQITVSGTIIGLLLLAVGGYLTYRVGQKEVS